MKLAIGFPRCVSRSGAACAAAVLLLASWTSAARAESLTVAIVPTNTDVTVPPGSSGTFEVVLLNAATNTESFDVAGFQFEFRVATGSGVLFADATTATTTTYIFAGNSIADTSFGGSLIISPPPPPATADIVGFDTVATPNSSTTLNPGDTFGLGLVSFTVAADASPGVVTIAIIPFDSITEPNGTQLVDRDGFLLDFTTLGGTITIGAAVPEPSSLALATCGATGLLVAIARRRMARANAARAIR